MRKISWESIVSGTVSVHIGSAHVFNEETDIEVVVSRVLNNGTIVSFHGHGLLVGPNADL